MKKPWGVIILVGMLAVGFVISCGAKKGEDGQSEEITDIKELIEVKCSACHFSARIFEKPQPRERWVNIVQRMRALNPNMMSEEDTIRILQYLYENNSLPEEGAGK